MKKLILPLIAVTNQLVAAPHDVHFSKINAAGTAFESIVLADPGADTFLKFNNATNTLEWSSVGGFDSTTVDDTTWSDGTNASNTWTFNVSGTDTTFVANNGFVEFSHDVFVGDELTFTGGGAIVRMEDGAATLTDSLLLLSQTDNAVVVGPDFAGSAFGNGAQTNPTLFVHSAIDPDVTPDQYLSFYHDQTDGVIVSGVGDVTVAAVTGILNVGQNGIDGILRLYDDDAGGDAEVSIQAPDALGTGYTLTLPANDGGANEFLQTNGSGVLTWAAAGGGLSNWEESGNDLRPTVAGAGSLGDTTKEVGGLYLNDTGGISFGAAQDAVVHRQNAAGVLGFHGLGADSKLFIHSDDSDLLPNPVNYEALTFTIDTAGDATIAMEAGGTGAVDDLLLDPGGQVTISPNSSTGILGFSSDSDSRMQVTTSKFDFYIDAVAYFTIRKSADQVIVDGGSTDLIIDGGKLSNQNEATSLGAAATTFAVDSDFVTLTGDAGGNTVATITGGLEGQRLTILFVDSLITITDDDSHAANTVDLNSDFNSDDDYTLTIMYDGTSWYEVTRSKPGLAYGSITVESNATTTTFGAASSDFSNKSQITVFDTDGVENGTDADHTNDHVSVTLAGTYEITSTISFSGGSADTYSFSMFKNNGATQLGARATRKLGAGGDVGDATVTAIVDLSASDTIELWIQNEDDTSAATIQDGSLSVKRID